MIDRSDFLSALIKTLGEPSEHYTIAGGTEYVRWRCPALGLVSLSIGLVDGWCLRASGLDLHGTLTQSALDYLLEKLGKIV